MRTESGEELQPPADWRLLPPGDGALTKLVKAKGPSWQVQIKLGRRTFSQGIWASEENIMVARNELTEKRATPQYAEKRERQLVSQAKKQQKYVQKFREEVLSFLDFHPRHRPLAEKIAEQVTAQATPVGSGTVARTERIPVADRASAAVIAWMRHQTTGYDRMAIARVKGRRRQVRRELARQSLLLFQPYRQGSDHPASCPLYRVLTSSLTEKEE